jgi:hypothetical protein
MTGLEKLMQAAEGLPEADLATLTRLALGLRIMMAPADDDGAALLAAGYPASHAFAPYDDEPVTDGDLARLAQGEVEYAAGQALPADEVWARLGA